MERAACMAALEDQYQQVQKGTGHAMFLLGEAGVGKTCVINALLKRIEGSAKIYTGACDSLFTPRPLGPLYDVASQVGSHFLSLLKTEKDRGLIFANLLRELSTQAMPVVLVFEDIHWADEATLDLIKFLTRRISRFKCLFLLTYRDDAIDVDHPLNSIFGQLPMGNFSKLPLDRFSREAVEKLAIAKGYSGNEIYQLTNGNPFYVMEILASYSPGIPKRVKDSVLTVFHAMSESTRTFWELLSIFPSGVETSLMEHLDSHFKNGIESCMRAGVIINHEDHFSFKHELFRLAIEESMSSLKRKSLHRKILKIMLESPAHSNNLARLVHHAKFADEKNIVLEFAPKAAEQAASIGSHIEASKLYRIAIECAGENDSTFVTLHERHAYECYLTNQIASAIESQDKVVAYWRNKKDESKEGDALRFLSRLWWFAGDQKKSKSSALESVKLLDKGLPSRERALAYSNLSQFFMLAEDSVRGLSWGNRAIDLAVQMEDKEILAHALTNVGVIKIKSSAAKTEGEENLKESLRISLANGFHDHAGRAYTNLFSAFVLIKKYKKANDIGDAGITYCETHDLSSWSHFILQWKARMLLETGDWSEAESIAGKLLGNVHHLVKCMALSLVARVKMRRGRFDEAKSLIAQAKKLALPTNEVKRLTAVLVAELELHWLTGETYANNDLDSIVNEIFPDKNNSWHYGELAYWMKKNGLTASQQVEYPGPYHYEMNGAWSEAAQCWNDLGCKYEEALASLDGNEKKRKLGLVLLKNLGATATHNKMRLKLKLQGVKNIPRGPHSQTRNNAAHLTRRQVEILGLLCEGLQNSEIGKKLFIATKTVDNHLSAILWKLEVNSRARAVLEAKKLGILK
ncbi:MAG TPA: AAA family ATPase [Cyclobacteriaceae bacterium]|nr:AAA family ATPase [Cyclobacteriaceae bacterium]